LEHKDVLVSHRGANAHVDALVGKLLDDARSELDTESLGNQLSQLRMTITRQELDRVDSGHLAELFGVRTAICWWYG
jgi:hypothetical protein